MSTKSKLELAVHSPHRSRRDTNTTGAIPADGRFRPQRAPGEIRAKCRSGTDLGGPAAITPAQLKKLRVLFITEDDPLYIIQFFDVFFDIYPREEIDICGITIDRAFHEPLQKTVRRMLRFYRPLEVFRLGLRFIYAKVCARSIETLAVSMGIPLVATQSVNQPEYIEQVRALTPDVIVSVAAPEVFQLQLLALPPVGCINIHSGRLPMYRGMMPTFWQMLRGEQAITITVHRMVEKLDAGDILATQAFPIRTSDSLDRVIKGTKREGARLLLRVLCDLREGKAEARPLAMEQSEYFSFPKREDVRAFRKRGHRLL